MYVPELIFGAPPTRRPPLPSPHPTPPPTAPATAEPALCTARPPAHIVELQRQPEEGDGRPERVRRQADQHLLVGVYRGDGGLGAGQEVQAGEIKARTQPADGRARRRHHAPSPRHRHHRHHRRRYHHAATAQVFRHNMTERDAPKIKDSNGAKDFTKITCAPRYRRDRPRDRREIAAPPVHASTPPPPVHVSQVGARPRQVRHDGARRGYRRPHGAPRMCARDCPPRYDSPRYTAAITRRDPPRYSPSSRSRLCRDSAPDDMAGCTHSSVKVYLNGKKLGCNDFKGCARGSFGSYGGRPTCISAV